MEKFKYYREYGIQIMGNNKFKCDGEIFSSFNDAMDHIDNLYKREQT